jgi:ring-1,2-phenylacetyl-CoA epoxidase subunit PaaA
MAAVEVPAGEQGFLEYVQGGGQVDATDWLPDDYRAKLVKFIEMHGNSELMGVLPEREWILRAPTLQRKLALTAKVQDEVGHAQLIYRRRGPREAARAVPGRLEPAGRSSTTSSTIRRRRGATSASSPGSSMRRDHQPEGAPQVLGAPYARIMKNLLGGVVPHPPRPRRDLTLVTARRAVRARAEALDRWWGPLMQFHGNPIPAEDDPMFSGGSVAGQRGARQQFLQGYVPQILELGLTIPDPKLRRGDDGVWHYSEPDWAELKSVVTGNGPRTAERLEFRRRFLEQEQWVRDALLAA